MSQSGDDESSELFAAGEPCARRHRLASVPENAYQANRARVSCTALKTLACFHAMQPFNVTCGCLQLALSFQEDGEVKRIERSNSLPSE